MSFLIFGSAFMLATVVSADEGINFNRDIRPILSDRCFQCHGPNEKDRKRHLRLDQSEGEEGAYRTYRDSTAIKPKDLKGSELWYRITTKDPDDAMPPADAHKTPLSDEEKSLFRLWIEEGAEFQGFWAFIPPKKSSAEKIKTKSWIEKQ